MAVFIAHHPGATRIDISEQLFDHQITRTTFNPRVSMLRRWLGSHPDTSEPLLPRITEREGYQLHPDVTTDLQLLIATRETPHATTQELWSALDLLRGRPLSGIPPRYYRWATALHAAARYHVTALAAELARGHFLTGDYHRAEQAAVRGLTVEPADEVLRRWQYRALHRLGATTALAREVEQLAALNTNLGTPFAPATTRLIHTLAHSTFHHV